MGSRGPPGQGRCPRRSEHLGAQGQPAAAGPRAQTRPLTCRRRVQEGSCCPWFGLRGSWCAAPWCSQQPGPPLPGGGGACNSSVTHRTQRDRGRRLADAVLCSCNLRLLLGSPAGVEDAGCHSEALPGGGWGPPASAGRALRSQGLHAATSRGRAGAEGTQPRPTPVQPEDPERRTH